MQEWPAAWSRRRATLLSTPPLRRTATFRGFLSGNEHDKYRESIVFAAEESDNKDEDPDSTAVEVEYGRRRVEKRGWHLGDDRERKR